MRGAPSNGSRHSKRRSNTVTIVSKLSGNKFVLIGAGFFCLASFSLFPILVLEGVGNQPTVLNTDNKASVLHALHGASSADLIPIKKKVEDTPSKEVIVNGKRTTKDGRILPALTASDLDSTLDSHAQDMPVARGVAGSPIEQTPALVDAVRAHIDCDVNVDTLAYWNDPIGTRDLEFTSPFAVRDDVKYISFAPDRGGWNNVRMSMEIIFVIAAATGRTLVLPPKEPLYLLHHDAAARHRGFADFFPLHTAEFQKRVRVISFEEFLEREKDGPLAPANAQELEALTAAADHCDKREKSVANCKPVFEYLKNVGFSPEISAVHTCLIFDENQYNGEDIPLDVQDHLHTVCGPNRQQVFWDQEIQQHKLVHFRASDKEYRLLSHFYGMIYFTNPAIDHYYKRFVRDFLHYHDEIYCAAGKIVKAVQAEGVARGLHVDAEGAGAFSALHVRRGDLQYKKVKIPAQEWYDNTKEVWLPKEILYVATDERDKSFFDDLAAHHDLRFLDDYWDLAGLGDLDPNYMGMIDTIVASRGRAFAGTWFSTFSGYINRLRGYHGMSMMDSWYSYLPKKTAVHEWKVVDDFAYAFEWPDGWVGIDKDEFPTRDKF
jgi:GDP-fucose protein O-fucosyltransferase